MALVKEITNNWRERSDELFILYNEKGRRGVSEVTGVSYNSVGHLLKALGFYDRKQEHNEALYNKSKFSDPFDGSDFADYLIGFILGDGSVQVINGRVDRFCISCSDEQLVQDIIKRWPYFRCYKSIKNNYV